MSREADALALAYEPLDRGAGLAVRIPRGGERRIEGLGELRISRLMASTLEATPEIGWRLILFGSDVERLGQESKDALRAKIALLPAAGGLLSSLNGWENILLPLGMHRPAALAGASRDISGCLEALGVVPDGVLEKLPESMTRYEKILVAFVRTVLERPELVLCEDLGDGLDAAHRAVVARFAGVYNDRCPEGTFAVFGAGPGAAGTPTSLH